MASKSTPGLLAAIEGYAGEHAGSKEHEPNIALLQRVKGEIEKGKGGDTLKDSPGAREARGAAQVNMAGEEGHDGGKGSIKTNEPGSFGANEDVADPQDASKGPNRSAGPAPSDGHLHSNLSAAKMPSGVIDFRRNAGLAALESGKSSAGNAVSNSPGKDMPASKRIGDVKPAAKTPPDENKGEDGFEGVPPFAKEPLTGDGWTKAREKARKLAPAAR